MLKGALAAALTPLRDGGDALDEDVFEPYVEFLAAGGLDGILALGTTGEGILLCARTSAGGRPSSSSRPRRTAFDVAVHCGAQTTSETVALSEHAAETGAAAVAVIGPPYYPLDERALTPTSPRPPRPARRSRSTSTSSGLGPGTRSRTR